MPLKKYSDIRELIISIRKQVLDADPSGTGKFINEFFDFRSRIKQNRLTVFIESFQTYIQQTHFKHKIHFDLLTEEDFTDIFESILRRVIITKSFQKLDRYKIIATKSLIEPIEVDFFESFLDLITRLHEIQIEILNRHSEISTSLIKEDLLGINNTLRIELSLQNELRGKGENNNYIEIKKRLTDFLQYRSSGFYNITQDQYLFFVQDLSSKSLLADYGIGGIGTNPYDLMEITEYGKQFLEFIKES